jgi:mannose-1-phosphate guanylyltransferase
MKAFLLAAGLGTRLRPITDHTPKCMLSVCGKPLLAIWLDALDRAGVGEVHINLHHLPEVVYQYLRSRDCPPLVRTSFEPVLLGSAGTLAAQRRWVEDDEVFLACNADNLTDFDLRSLVEFHRQSGGVASLTLFHSQHPSSCGVIEVDNKGLVVSFVEKPPCPSTDLSNAGMYAFHPSVIDEVQGPVPSDIGTDLLPGLVGRARAIPVNGYFRDIGTADAYEQAQREWPRRDQQ